jgi:hypothetical protein
LPLGVVGPHDSASATALSAAQWRGYDRLIVQYLPIQWFRSIQPRAQGETRENFKHGSQISDNAMFHENNSKPRLFHREKWLQIATPDPTLDIATRALNRTTYQQIADRCARGSGSAGRPTCPLSHADAIPALRGQRVWNQAQPTVSAESRRDRQAIGRRCWVA